MIIEALRADNNDDIWKYWIIKELLPLFSYKNLKPIVPCLKRISSNPTRGEITEEVDYAASDFLNAALNCM